MGTDSQKIFASNLKKLLDDTGKSQLALAEYVGVSTATVSHWVSGKNTPLFDKIDLICDFFNVGRNQLLNAPITVSIKDKQKARGVKIPVLGYVAGGVPLEMITDIIDDEEIPIELARTGTMFGLKIRGDSMTPRIKDGDVVIVRSQPDVDSGQIAIVAVNGDAATCKQIKKHHDGIELIPFNPSHPTRFFSHEEVTRIPVTIIGKVVELRAKFE